MKPTLAGKSVVIVGGTSGMGRGAAEAAAAQGARVIAVSRRKVSAPVQLDQGSSIESAVLDMTDEAAVRAFFEEIGALDHLLVTATPPVPGGAFLDSSYADAEAVLRGKLLGSWACARHAAPRMRPGGSITFVTGGVAVRPSRGAVMMSAAFAALEALARGLALELGPIRVNAIRPGVIESEMWASTPEDRRLAFFDKVRQRFPVGRPGRVEDIGHAAVFLMTNAYVTGAVLEVTGGEHLVNLD